MQNLTTTPTAAHPTWCARRGHGPRDPHVSDSALVPLVVLDDAVATLGAHQVSDEELWTWPHFNAELVQTSGHADPIVMFGSAMVSELSETGLTLDSAEKLAQTLLAFVEQARAASTSARTP